MQNKSAGNTGSGIDVLIGKNVSTIPAYLFYAGGTASSPKIKNVTFESTCSCVKVGNGAFRGCATLESMILPNSVETISAQAFHECNALLRINIPEGVKTIGSSAFKEYKEYEFTEKES